MGRNWILLLKVSDCDDEVGCLVGVRFAARVICLCKGARRRNSKYGWNIWPILISRNEIHLLVGEIAAI